MQVNQPGIRYENVHPWERWASLAGGAALMLFGARKGKKGIPLAIAGVALLHRGATGRCEAYRMLGVRSNGSKATIPYELGIRARASVTIQQPRQQIYDFWRQLDNLPCFMRHLITVEMRDAGQSYWVAQGPLNRKVEWTPQIINEIPGELLAWKSLPGGDVDNAGLVRFRDAPGGRGTEIRVELQYNPPAGAVGAFVARLLGREPEQEIEADLGRLKQLLEGGELATTEGQPHGSKNPVTAAVDNALAEVIA